MLGSKTHILLRAAAIIVILAAAFVPSSRHRSSSARLDAERTAPARAEAPPLAAPRVVTVAHR